MKPRWPVTLIELIAASDANIGLGGDGWVSTRDVFPDARNGNGTGRLWCLFGGKHYTEQETRYIRGGKVSYFWRPTEAGRAAASLLKIDLPKQGTQG